MNTFIHYSSIHCVFCSCASHDCYWAWKLFKCYNIFNSSRWLVPFALKIFSFILNNPTFLILVDPGVIVNLRGITDDGSSVRLSWDAPPCPNGPLTGYNIYYRQSTFIQNGAYIDSRGYSMVQIRSSQASIVRTN